MNFKPLLIAVALLCLSFSSFSQPKTKMTALEYNDYLSAVTDSLYSKGNKWGTRFTKIKESDKDYSRLKPLRKDIMEFLILKKEEIRKFPAVPIGGEGLKQAMISFMDYEMEMIEKAFMPMESLNSESSDKEVDKAIDNLIAQSDREADYLNMVRVAQTAYAKENGFTIEKAEEEEE